MKPTFALDLTRDAIALLHRTPKGWLSIGEVAFDAPDLAETLDYLRKTALGLSPMGMACKLILPNSQILYTEVHAPGPSREDKRRQIAAALEGRTPYAVEDLVFDWSGKGQTVKVAVVARETLEEAESFAATHRLNPVSFVAIPEADDFVGEPWFGPSAGAEAVLAPGESVDRDREPVVILQREAMSGLADVPAAADQAPEPAPEPEPAPIPQATQPPVEDDGLPGLDEALNAELPLREMPLPELIDPPLPEFADVDDPADDPEEAALAAALAAALPGDAGPAAGPSAPTVPERVDPPVPEAAMPQADAFPADMATATVDPSAVAVPQPVVTGPPIDEPPVPVAQALPAGAPAEPAIDTTGGLAPAELETEEAPFAHVADPTTFVDDVDQAVSAVPAAPAPSARPAPLLSDIIDDLPPAPPPAAMLAFASRRTAASAGAARPLDGAVRGAAAARPPVAAPATPPATTPKAAPVMPAAAPAAQAVAASASPAQAAVVAPPPGSRPVTPGRPAAAARGFQGLVTAPSIPGTRPKGKGKPGLADPGIAAAAALAGPRTVKPLSRPGGTFGAAPARNRSGVALMVMVGLLLLFLAFIAAVSSYFLSQNGAAPNDTARLADPVVVVPGVDDEMLADLQDPEGMTEPLPEAAGPALAEGDAGALATETLDLATVSPDDLAAPAADEAVAAESPVEPVETAETLVTPASPAEAAPVAASAAEPAPETVVATDVRAAETPVEDQDEIFLSAMDAPPPALDALALPTPSPVVDAAPPAPMPPPAFGTVYRFDDKGLLVPTPDGILSPEGIMLFAGPPPLVPPARSEVAAAAAQAAAAASLAAAPPEVDSVAATAAAGAAAPVTAADASLVTAGTGTETAAAEDGAEASPADPTLSGFRPRPRPDGLVPAPDDDAALTDTSGSEFAGLRPLRRPQIVLAAAAASKPADLGAQGASLTAQSEAELAAAAALEASNPSIVAISRRPQPRPSDLSAAVEAAVAAAVREPEVVAAAATPESIPEAVDELDEPAAASGGPSIPTSANVANQATFANAINLSKMNLIGTYGTDSRRSALIRQSNGRYKKVEVGDKIDGGTVMAITEGEVRYQKGGKLLILAMPKA